VADIEAKQSTEGHVTDSPCSDDKNTPKARRGCRLAVIGVIALLCAALITIWVGLPLLVKSRKVQMDEVTENLFGIRTAQFEHQARAGSFVAAGPHPRSIDDLSTAHAEWTPGSTFDPLGWAPSGLVQATYQVEVLPDSLDFIAHAWVDADGDGVPAHFTITKSSQPVRVTPKSVR
jgi:hypothetical protein